MPLPKLVQHSAFPNSHKWHNRYNMLVVQIKHIYNIAGNSKHASEIERNVCFYLFSPFVFEGGG